jgi:hypothetical protein
VTLLARAPREVYRVYSEEEFFGEDELFACGEDGLCAGVASTGLFEPAGSPGAGERRLRRLAGVAALAGAVGAVVATFAVTGRWPAAGAVRRAVPDASATAPTRIATAHASVPGARREAAPPVHRLLTDTKSLRPRGGHRRPGASRDADVRRWHGGEYARRYAVPAPRTAPAPVLARPNSAPMDVASANAAPVDVATASGVATTTPQPQHAEFGFER